MFTGLIADLGILESVERDDAGATLLIRTQLAGELAPGDSIAVNGVCLTAVEVSGGSFRAEAIPETLARSSLGALSAGVGVNLELAMRAGDRLGGHIVQGHVDGVGRIGHTRTDHLRIMGLAEAAAHFAVDVLAPGGAFLAKVLQGGTERELLDLLKRSFTSVRHVKPPASRSDSAELYVLATGFRGTPGA